MSREDLTKHLLSESTGNTGETCRATLKYLLVHRLPILIFEQDDRMLGKADKFVEEWNWFVNTGQVIGYHIDAKLYRSKDFLAPSTRTRTYGVCIEYEDLGIPYRAAVELGNRIHDSLEMMMRSVKNESEDASAYMLPDKHPDIKAELERLGDTKAKELEESNNEVSRWKNDLAQQAKKYGLKLSDVRAAQELQESSWIQRLPARDQRGLQVHLLGVPSATFVETSQSICHMTVGSHVILIQT